MAELPTYIVLKLTSKEKGTRAIVEVCSCESLRPAFFGTWSVAIGYDPDRSFMCSMCQRMSYEPSPFCPFCGARMEEIE